MADAPPAPQFTPEQAAEGKVMAILAYFGILCLIPWFLKKDNPFVFYHAKQGLSLFVIGVIVAVVCNILGTILAHVALILGLLFNLVVMIFFLAVLVLGITTVLAGKCEPHMLNDVVRNLPGIGQIVQKIEGLQAA